MKIESFQGEHRFLSNFWPAEVVWERVRFPTVEHAYQAAKSLDEETRLNIARLPTAGQAKRVGRGLLVRPDWDQVKVATMLDLVRQKFQHAHLRDLLLATGSAELIEGNTWGDRFWGVCRGSGENHLGRILMQVRGELQ